MRRPRHTFDLDLDPLVHAKSSAPAWRTMVSGAGGSGSAVGDVRAGRVSIGLSARSPLERRDRSLRVLTVHLRRFQSSANRRCPRFVSILFRWRLFASIRTCGCTAATSWSRCAWFTVKGEAGYFENARPAHRRIRAVRHSGRTSDGGVGPGRRLCWRSHYRAPNVTLVCARSRTDTRICRSCGLHHRSQSEHCVRRSPA